SVVVTIATPSGIVAAETARYPAQSVRWAWVRRWARGCMPPPKRLCAPATSAFGPLPAGNPLYPSLPMGLAPASLGDPGPAGAGKRRTPLPGRCRARIASVARSGPTSTKDDHEHPQHACPQTRGRASLRGVVRGDLGVFGRGDAAHHHGGGRARGHRALPGLGTIVSTFVVVQLLVYALAQVPAGLLLDR